PENIQKKFKLELFCLFYCEQMLCVKAYMAQQPDELSLEKAEVILVILLSHLFSSDWVEGTRLSDFQRGWVLKSHLETISNSKVKARNLSDAFKLTTCSTRYSRRLTGVRPRA
uniref:SH3 domain-containing protein n=1 Tax=Oryzias sinensis TaxID=183150 RepID=A0A8C8DIN4_9TELE